MRYKDLLKQAESLGRESGNNAADWYWDRTDPDLDDFRAVLKGIRDGDPLILDTFIPGSLSGEHADDMTPNRLYEELGVSEAQLRSWEESSELDELCEAWGYGFNSAYTDAVESSCLEGLRRDVTFHASVTIDEQTEAEISSAIFDLLAKLNCDISDVTFEEE